MEENTIKVLGKLLVIIYVVMFILPVLFGKSENKPRPLTESKKEEVYMEDQQNECSGGGGHPLDNCW